MTSANNYGTSIVVRRLIFLAIANILLPVASLFALYEPRVADRVRSTPTEPVERSIYFKLPLRQPNFHWKFLGREKLLSGKLILQVSRDDTASEIVVFENGQISNCWREIPSSHGPSEQAIYFGFESTCRYLTAPRDELTIELTVPCDLAGIGSIMTGTLSAGVYSSKAKFTGLTQEYQAPESLIRKLGEDKNLSTDQKKAILERHRSNQQYRAFVGAWTEQWPLKITSRKGWLSEEKAEEYSRWYSDFVIVPGSLCAKRDAHFLDNDEKTRLYNSVGPSSSIGLDTDVSYTERITVSSSPTGSKRHTLVDPAERILGELIAKARIPGHPATEPRETLFVSKRIRVKGVRTWEDLTTFADTAQRQAIRKLTIISNNFDYGDVPTYLIDHESKSAFIKGMSVESEDVEKFGRVDRNIRIEIHRICAPTDRVPSELFVEVPLPWKGPVKLDDRIVDEIKCVNTWNGKLRYSIFLDSNDWSMCRKIAYYDPNTGSVSKTIEYKDFKPTGEDRVQYPYTIVRRHFDEQGQESKTETIEVTNVMIDEVFKPDVFEFDVPADYTIYDLRNGHVLKIAPGEKFPDNFAQGFKLAASRR